ncbi:MAG: patatin-like phospholipase family protein [Cytophagales bacterium]|nr:patatin-like phospholipase family protein [Cytophagales bacterium]
MKALVISGGGNKGAFAGGIAEFLIKELKKDYQVFLGTSTGSLLIPLLSVGRVDRIKKVFTSVTQEDIFSTNPFRTVTDKNGKPKTKIHHLNVIKMFVKNKKTFGESENLRKLIRRSFTLSDFNELKSSNRSVVVTVANFSRNHVEYKHSNKCHYLDFCDWVWASANLVPFMSLLHKDGCDYADGGFGIFIPIQKAIEMGATEIDAIILRTQKVSSKIITSDNPMELFLNSFSFMINQIAIDNIKRSMWKGKENKVKINYYYIPDELTNNVLLFEPSKMSVWWEEGFEYAANTDPVVLDSRKKSLLNFFN